MAEQMKNVVPVKKLKRRYHEYRRTVIAGLPRCRDVSGYFCFRKPEKARGSFGIVTPHTTARSVKRRMKMRG